MLDEGGCVTEYISKCNMILHCKHLNILNFQLLFFFEIKFLYNVSSHFLPICFIRDIEIKVLAKTIQKQSNSKVPNAVFLSEISFFYIFQMPDISLYIFVLGFY